LNTCADAFTKPVTTVGLESSTPGVHSVHDALVDKRYDTLYPVTAGDTEFVHASETCAFPGVPTSNVAAAGIVAADNTEDSAEHPAELQALSVKPYSVPAVKPVLLNDSVAAVIVLETSVPPRRNSYRVIGEPFVAGAAQDTRIADAVADVNVSTGAFGAEDADAGDGSVSSDARPASRNIPVSTRGRRTDRRIVAATVRPGKRPRQKETTVSPRPHGCSRTLAGVSVCGVAVSGECPGVAYHVFEPVLRRPLDALRRQFDGCDEFRRVTGPST